MKQLIIKQNDIYKVADIEYFQFDYYYLILRDVYVDISKNNKRTLERIATKCELNCKGLRKKELIDLIEKSGCLVLGN